MTLHKGSIPTLGLFLASALLLSSQACADGEPGPEAQAEALESSAAAAPAVPETEAEAALAAAIVEAEATDRLLFVHSGADW